jgi:hypothetical protein
MDLRGGTSLQLHDATLESIEILWESRICICKLRQASPDQKTTVLRFTGVTEVHVPHSNPWGPSSSVLEVSETVHSFKIEMQSGDTVSIEAIAVDVDPH